MKLLVINQASVLSTGYGVYGKRLIQYLVDNYGLSNVAELACDLAPNDPLVNTVPWKVYGNLFANDEEKSAYDSHPLNPHGQFRFVDVCLDWQVTHVISITDIWFSSWLLKHPYRRFYNVIMMPATDAKWQMAEWLDDYRQVDALLMYQQWSNDLCTENKLKVIGNAPYVPSEDFIPLNREAIKKQFNIDGFLIGTVMRNQRRKRFPELFSAFSKLLKENQNFSLWCHTSYPDGHGWDFPNLLLRNNIAHKVYFTYICQNCRYWHPSLFKGTMAFCPNCNQRSMMTANPKYSLSDKEMAVIYNSFDLYVQYVTNEALGMPQLEAAACGTPVLATAYSAMEDVLTKIDGKGLDYTLYQESESDRMMACPSEKDFVKQCLEIYNLSYRDYINWRDTTFSQFKQNFSLEKTLPNWKKAIDSCGDKENWNSNPRYHNPHPWDDKLNGLKNSDFVQWAIVNVLGEPDKLGTFFETRLISDLDTTIRNNGTHIATIFKKNIYDELSSIRNMINQAENYRITKLSR